MQMLMKRNVIIGAETWIYGHDVETKAQSSQWVSVPSPRPQKSTGSLVQCESDTVFFYCEGIIHHEFLPCGQIVNKEYYLVVMKRLRGAVGRKRPDLWRGKKWLLHHDNALAHSSLLIYDFLKP